MQLVQKASIKAAIPKRVPLVKTATLDSTRIVLPKIIVTIVLRDSFRTKLDSSSAPVALRITFRKILARLPVKLVLMVFRAQRTKNLALLVQMTINYVAVCPKKSALRVMALTHLLEIVSSAHLESTRIKTNRLVLPARSVLLDGISLVPVNHLVATVTLDSIREVPVKPIVSAVLVDNTPPPDSHRARHVAKDSMLQVRPQPIVKTVMQANIRKRIRPPHIPARSVRQGNLLSTHNPLAPTVTLENTRHQVVQQVRRATTAPPGTLS